MAFDLVIWMAEVNPKCMVVAALMVLGKTVSMAQKALDQLDKIISQPKQTTLCRIRAHSVVVQRAALCCT